MTDNVPGCKRTDNLATITVKPTDEVDHAAVNRVLPILISRHAFCVPSAECMSDALSRENL
jgi:hypothetical protein